MTFKAPEGFEPIEEAPVVHKPPEGFEPIGSPVAEAPISAQQERGFPSNPGTDLIVERSSLGRLLDAFGQGAKHGWGTSDLAHTMDPLLGKVDDVKGLDAPGFVLKAFNEAITRPAFALGEMAMRGTMAAYNSFQAAGVALGLPKDVVSMPDAFMGSPGALGKITVRPRTQVTTSIPVAQDLNVIGPERKPIHEGTPAEAARNVVPPIEAYHGSPYSFDVFSTEKIGTGEGAQTFGHGLYFSEHPEVASSYAEKLGPGRGDKAEDVAKRLLDIFEGDRKAAIAEAENRLASAAKLPEEFRAKDSALPDALALLKSDEPIGSTLYKTRVHADKDHFFDWDKPPSEQTPYIKEAIKSFFLGGKTSWGFVPKTGEDFIRALAGELGSKKAASDALAEAGVKGIKYYDQGSRNAVHDISFLEEQLARQKTWEEKRLREVAAGVDTTTTTEIAAAIAKSIEELKIDIANANKPTHNLVVFDARDVEITHRNGQPVERPAPAPVPEKVPGQELAPRTTTEPVAVDKAGNIRLDLLDISGDAKDVIRRAAEANGEFQQARTGDIPLAQVDTLMTVTGMSREMIEPLLPAMGRTLKNDNMVRAFIQGMIQSADEVSAAMKKAAITESADDLIEFQRLRMRHEMLQEQVAGLTAEWGRTGKVFQEFNERVKDAQSLGQFLRDKKKAGATMEELLALVKAGAELDPRTQLPRFLTDQRKPGMWDKFMYYYTNSLLSGPFSQAFYALTDATFALTEAALVTPVAATIGKIQQVFSKTDIERVYYGETYARVYGLVAGTPDAIIATVHALKSGLPVLLPSQAAERLGAGGNVAKRPGIVMIGGKPTMLGNANAFTQQRPIGGALGTIIGLPSRAIEGIHTFFEFVNYRSNLQAEAYREAASRKMKDPDTNFWMHQRDLVQFPTDEMMTNSAAFADYMTFVDKLGPKAAAAQRVLDDTKIGRFIVPFYKVLINVTKRTQELTPLAFLDANMRADLIGTNGAVRQQTAMARMILGTTMTGWIAKLVLDDTVTGEGPFDPKQRAEWLLTHQPYSIKINGYWYNHQRWGQFSNLLSLTANLVDIGKDLRKEEYAEAATRLVHGASNILVDTTGLSGPYQLARMISDPKRYGPQYLANLGQSMLPMSALMGQTAAFMDPIQRDTKQFIDGLKGRVPGLRETLFPVRSWTGEIMANDREGWGAFMRARAVNADPADLEMQRLNIWPAKVPNHIRGVELTPEQYDVYQSTAGPLTRMMLNSLVNSPNWAKQPDFAREKLFKAVIENSRAAAAAAMQGRYPQLVQDAVKNQVDKITGQKKIPQTFDRP